MKKMIVASTSTVYGGAYLEYILPTLKSFFKEIDEILFIPYARPSGISYDEYTEKVNESFAKIAIKVKGIHELENAKIAIKNAQAIFIGGGNTFVLVNEIYQQNLFPILKKVIENGTLYFGTSAGSNIVGLNLKTTNDMPVVYPKSFQTLGLIPFNINPHYLDADPNSMHKGETRETRIEEFHTYNETPVVGLREGSWLEVDGNDIVLKGNLKAKLFQKDKTSIELKPESNLSK
ncbi:MAG: dipeptidase PepE [Flavobacteriaceae bacterium]|nr:dipeptidase PepE [Flavobacteriaceae bacterium]